MKHPEVFKEPGVLTGEIVFYFVDTIGLPLEIVIMEAQQRRLFIDWRSFIDKAVSCNWSDKRIYDCRKLANSYYTEKWVEKTWGIKRNEISRLRN